MNFEPPTDDEILEVFAHLGPNAVGRGLHAISSLVPADDWKRNSVASLFGAPGVLQQAVEADARWSPDIGFSLWDGELLDIVADVTGLGADAFVMHWMDMQECERLAQLAARYVASATGQSVVRRSAPEPLRRAGPPDEMRAQAVQHLRKAIKADDMLKIFDDMGRLGNKDWASEHFMFGMSIRNSLRSAGFSERNLGEGNLDDVWVDLVWDAVST